jgi:transcriptional/translational regulatory protein YebC/TACO1
MGISPESQSLQRIPNLTKELDLEGSRKVLKLIDLLEDNDDVQNVFHNLEMTDELATALEGA